MQKNVLAVLVRVGGVAMLLWGLQMVPLMIVNISQAPTPVSGWLNAVVLTATVAVPLMMILFASWLVPRQVTRAASESDGSGFDHRSLQEIGLSMVGLYFLLRGIIDTFYWIIYYRALLSYGSSYGNLSPDNLASIVTTGLELVLGLVVFLGARRLGNLLVWARSLHPRVS